VVCTLWNGQLIVISFPWEKTVIFFILYFNLCNPMTVQSIVDALMVFSLFAHEIRQSMGRDWKNSFVSIDVKAQSAMLAIILMDDLHWQILLAKMLVTATRGSHYCTCLGQLGRHNTDRIVSIFCRATQGCQGKYKCVAVVCHCRRHYCANLCQHMA
jgi:hypothetical protein